MTRLFRFSALPLCLAIVCLSGEVLAQVEFIPYGHTWNFFRGTTEPCSPDPLEWTQEVFNDSRWETGATGIGYGDDDDATVLDDMEGNYVSVYFRTTFNATNVNTITSLLLTAYVDDGMVVYLNGIEVARFALGPAFTPVAFMDTAGGHEGDNPEFFDLTENTILLNEGENTLAVQVHNQDIDSSDLTFNVRLSGNDPRAACLTGLDCSTENSGVLLTWTNNALYDSIAVTRNGAPVAGSPLPGDATEYFDDTPGDYNNDYSVTATLGDGGVLCDPIICSPDDVDVDIIQSGDEWNFFRGTLAPSDPATDWRTSGFIDSLWETGPSCIGYGDDDDATVLDEIERARLGAAGSPVPPPRLLPDHTKRASRSCSMPRNISPSSMTAKTSWRSRCTINPSRALIFPSICGSRATTRACPAFTT